MPLKVLVVIQKIAACHVVQTIGHHTKIFDFIAELPPDSHRATECHSHSHFILR